MDKARISHLKHWHEALELVAESQKPPMANHQNETVKEGYGEVYVRVLFLHLEWAWDHCWSTGPVSQQKTNWIEGGGKWSMLNLLLWELQLLFLTVYSHTANRDDGYCFLSAFNICTDFSAIARKPKGSNHEKHIYS